MARTRAWLIEELKKTPSLRVIVGSYSQTTELSLDTKPGWIHRPQKDRLTLRAQKEYVPIDPNNPYDEAKKLETRFETVGHLLTVKSEAEAATLYLTVRHDGVAEFFLPSHGLRTGNAYPANGEGWKSIVAAIEQRANSHRKSNRVASSHPGPPVETEVAVVVPPVSGGPLDSARAVDRSGKVAEARRLYQEIIANGPLDERIGAIFSLAYLEQVGGDVSAAISLYEEVLEADDPAYRRLARNNLKFIDQSD